ncbi:MAG: CoA transferase [Deltaproteobacteria bacterium]|nr:CoA transferase [Deltaproteobacteria bacterium]
MTSMSDFAAGPLSGVRVLDLSRVIAGPYVGRLFRDMGAEVIKLEPPTGDESREIAPKHDRGGSWMFTFTNVGKRSIALDLGKPGASDVLLALARVCDAVIENFRPGVLERLGLGWERLHAENPRAVLLSINGFGSDSKLRDRRAYAPIVHAATGLLRDRGQLGQAPAQPRNAFADVLSGLHGAVALLAALRVSEATGVGEHVEVAMFDATLASHSESGNVLLDPPDDRSMNPVYPAGAHGFVAIAGAESHVWVTLSRMYASELEDPATAEPDLETRSRKRQAAIAAWMARQPTLDGLLEKLTRAKLACAPVVTPREALSSELARERELLTRVDDRRGGRRPVVRPPARFSSSRNEIRGPAPLPGEHGPELLHELLGWDDAKIAALRSSGILVTHDTAKTGG